MKIISIARVLRGSNFKFMDTVGTGFGNVE